MTSPTLLPVLITILVVSATSPAQRDPAPTARAKLPNIVLCMADDQGWGDAGYQGHPVVKTPNLDAMAKASLRFERFYAAAPVCSPTRAGVLTGRHPNRMNVRNHGRSMRPQETTIAEALKRSGYATGHFGKWHVGSVQKTSPVNPGNSGFDTWVSAPNFFDMNPIMSHGGVAVQHEGESSAVIVDAAIEFIRNRSKEETPFLAVVWFASPHDPHRASPEDLALYEKGRWQGYFAEISAMDRAIGRLRDEIARLGLRDDTLFWYTSDNGGLVPQSSGGRARKGSIYEGGLRVPALIEWPSRIEKPRTTEIPCNSCDIYPTLLELTNTDVPGQFPLDGVSLVSLIDGKDVPRSEAMGFWRDGSRGRATWSHRLMSKLLEAQRNGREVGEITRLDLDAAEIEPVLPEDRHTGHSARLDWPWKLHRIVGRNGDVRVELYDLTADPMERENLATKLPERAAAMHERLRAWLTSVIRSHNGADYSAAKKR